MKKIHVISYSLYVGLISAVLYIFTARNIIDPVISAKLVADYLGLTPFPPLSHPLWELLVRATAIYSPFSIGISLNTLNALIMGTINALLCSSMMKWSWKTIPEKYRYPPNMHKATWLSAVTSSAVFLVLLPVWVAGSRISPLPFDVLLLCLLLAFFYHTYKKPTLWKTVLISLFWGVLVTEYSTMIILSPFMGLAVFALLWKKKKLNTTPIILCISALILGLGVYVIMALRYYHCPAYVWRDFEGFHQIFWYLLSGQYNDLKATAMTVGWLLIMAFLFIPWLLLVLLPVMDQRRTHYRPNNYLLFGVLLLIGVFILFNLPPAPWFFTKLRSLLLLPYLAFSAWLGRLTGLFYLTTSAPVTTRSFLGTLRKKLRIAPVITAIILVGVAAVRNYKQADMRPLKMTNQLAEQIVTHLDGRNRLITSGLLDYNIMIAAHENNIDLAVLNLPLGISKSYRCYVSSLFENPRLKNLATIGWDSLLQEWRTTDADFSAKAAVLQPTELWPRLGYIPAPLPLAYFGESSNASITKESLLNANDFWQQNSAQWSRIDTSSPILGMPWIIACRMYSSQINNNLGILLEDHQLENQAAAAYQRAIQLETNNVSATMNLLALQKRLNNPNAENTEKQLETMLATRLKQLSVWQLSSRYGYIRDPAFYMAQGYAWAISGKPSAAIHEIKRAMEITGEKSDIKHILANLYIQADDINAGQQTYQALLDSNPEDTQALYGLARLAVTKGNVQLAQQYLTQLQQLGMNPDSKELEELFISIAIQNDDYSNSKKMLRDMLKKNPDNVRLWAVLGYLAGTNNDIGTANEARDILQRHLEHNPVFAVVLAQLEAQQGSLETAGNYLKTAVQHLPSNIRIREQYLETLVNLRRRDKAEEQAAAILNMDPDNALANYIMGTIQASRSELALAENSYRTSLKSKTNPMVLNDLAWLLARTGSFDEAHSLVNKSLKLFPNNPNALDTLGYIQLNIGEYKQGEDNIRRALNFYPNNPTMLLHLALSLEKQGKAEQALQIAEPLLTRMHEMTMDDYETTRQLTTRLR